MITDCPLSLISSNASVTFLPFVLKALQRQGFNFTYGKLMLLYLLTKSSCVLITFICQGHWSNCLFIIFIELFKLFCYIFITQRTASVDVVFYCGEWWWWQRKNHDVPCVYVSRQSVYRKRSGMFVELKASNHYF